jgi:hypothetical protein
MKSKLKLSLRADTPSFHFFTRTSRLSRPKNRKCNRHYIQAENPSCHLLGENPSCHLLGENPSCHYWQEVQAAIYEQKFQAALYYQKFQAVIPYTQQIKL